MTVELVLLNSAAPPCSILFPVVPCPNPQEDDAKFLEFSKRAEGGPSRAGRLSKTFRLRMKTVGVPGGCDCGGNVILGVETFSPRGVIYRRVLTLLMLMQDLGS